MEEQSGGCGHRRLEVRLARRQSRLCASCDWSLLGFCGGPDSAMASESGWSVGVSMCMTTYAAAC